jgi:hypothetical protein
VKRLCDFEAAAGSKSRGELKRPMDAVAVALIRARSRNSGGFFVAVTHVLVKFSVAWQIVED